MKAKIVMLLVGIVLGSASSGYAAHSQHFWKERGATYSCEGSSRSGYCKETNWKPAYGVHIIPGQVGVSFGGNLVFYCKRGYRPIDNCSYIGP